MDNTNLRYFVNVPPRLDHLKNALLLLLLGTFLSRFGVAQFSLQLFFSICGTRGLGARRQRGVVDDPRCYCWASHGREKLEDNCQCGIIGGLGGEYNCFVFGVLSWKIYGARIPFVCANIFRDFPDVQFAHVLIFF